MNYMLAYNFFAFINKKKKVSKFVRNKHTIHISFMKFDENNNFIVYFKHKASHNF